MSKVRIAATDGEPDLRSFAHGLYRAAVPRRYFREHSLQYSFEDVKRMSYAQLGAVEDPKTLMLIGFVSPMLVRYVVRTDQLEQRCPGIALSQLLYAMDKAASNIGCPHEVWQRVPMAKRDPIIDHYLDSLGPQLLSALRPN